jgi:hypothetical protein
MLRKIKSNAVFDVIHTDHRVIAIDDLYVGTTVTNDAENVIRALDRDLGLKGRRVIYHTNGRWDELIHEDGEFVCFAFIGKPTLEDALEIL